MLPTSYQWRPDGSLTYSGPSPASDPGLRCFAEPAIRLGGGEEPGSVVSRVVNRGLPLGGLSRLPLSPAH